MTSRTSGSLGLIALSLLTSQAWAQAPSPSYYYGGVAAGQSRANLGERELTRNQLGAATDITGTSNDERDAAYKAFLGYQFNRYLALEGGYFDLGKSSFTADTAGPGRLTGKLKTRGWNIDLVGALPLTPKFSLLGRIGAQRAKTQADYVGTGTAVPAFPDAHESHTNYKYGAGLQYEITPAVLLRGEWEHYRINNVADGHHRVNVASLSLVFPFGRAMTPAPRRVAEAPYVAPAPEPAPAPPPPAPPVEKMPERVSFTAESLFGFDQDKLRPEGQQALDGFTQNLQGTQYDTIQITGHTDRLGSEAYNLRLSERRAAAVKGYLVNTRGLDASRITATGVGESQPVTRPEDCRGTKRTAALVTCLQPDRRVDVDVQGTR